MIQEPVMDTLLFFEGHQDTFDLFETFEEYLYNMFPVIRKRVQKTQISYSNRYIFACVSFARVKRKAELPKGFLVLTIGLSAPLNSDRIAQKSEPYPGRWTHHIVISRPEELDEELLGWIWEAYNFADKK